MFIDTPNSSVSNVVLSTFTSSALVVWLMQIVKKSKWLTFVEEGKPALNRFVSVIAAMIANLGVSYSWDPQTHALTIAGLSLVGLLTAGWHWLNHFAMQEVMYQVAVNKPTAPTLAQQEKIIAQGAQIVAVEPAEVREPAK